MNTRSDPRSSPARSESGERLRLAVRAANVGLWDWDLRTNKVYYSPEWKRQIGYDEHEIGDDLEEWRSRVHPEDLDNTLGSVRAYRERRVPDYEAEFRFRHKDGSYRWILAQGALVNDEQGKPLRFVGAHVDITQRRRAEEALRESEELHRVTLANMSDTVLIADEGGRLCYVCPNVSVIFGYSPPEIMALGAIDKLLGVDVFDPAELDRKTELRNIERTITAKDAVERRLLIHVKRVSIHGGTVLYTCRDITERNQSEDIFRSMAKGTAVVGEEFFRSLVRELATSLGVRYAFVGEVSPDAPERVRTLAVWADGELSENFEYPLAGTPCENVVGKSLCFYPAGVQESFPEDALLAQMGGVSYIGTPVFGTDGKPLGLTVVLHDRPMVENDRAKSVLTVFAARAGAELERLRSEQARRKSEARFRAIVEDQTEMIVRWKPDGARTFANRAYFRFFGESSAGYPLIQAEDRAAIARKISALTPAHPVLTEIHESLSPSGHALWQEWTDRGLFDDDGRLIEVQSTGRDITERRRAEIRIRQLNRVYAVLSTINETIVREGDPLRLFDAACRIAVEKGGFGMAWVGLVNSSGDKVQLAAHAGASPDTLERINAILEDPDQSRAVAAQILRTQEHVVCNNIALDAQAAVWRDVAGERGFRSMASLALRTGGAMIGTFNIYADEIGFFDEQEMRLLDELASDIGFAIQVHQREAERRRAEAARTESEERFRQLTDAIQDVFWMTDPARTRVLYVSPAYASVWGRSCESLHESPESWLEAIHPDDRARVTASHESIATRRAGQYNEEYRITRPDGQVRWIRDRAFPVLDGGDQVKYVVGVARDVTEQRVLEEQFRQSQKMEAVGRLAGGVAHDFNNILSAILMQAALAAESKDLPAEAREDLEQIRLYAKRAANLTRQLLLFSRSQVLQPRELNLNEVVTNLANMLQRIIGEDVRLELHLHPTPMIVRADAGMLDQVIVNLAVNARDAMPQGGRLLIETADKTVDAAFARLHPDAAPGRYCWMSVSDTGAGITLDVLPRIFEPFFTTKEPGKGTGLGLATVYGIVKQHRGWIQVYSEPGQGASFQIFLPAADAPAAAERAGSGAAPRGGTETILLAEDEEPVRRLIRTVLERHGYQVMEAANGEEALRLWRQSRGGAALLLTDLIMPGAPSGQQLARELQADDSRLKVVFISGYSAELAGRELELRPGENFLQKPFGPNQLLDAIRRSLD